MAGQQSEIEFKLTKKQQAVLLTEATEIFYGGAAGGGKSLMLRFSAIMYCQQIPHLQAYLFRRLSPDLRKNHMDGATGFRALLDPWVEAGLVEITMDEIRFWNKSKIHLCHCQEEKDKYKYQGAEINLLLMDELTHFTDSIYRFLRGRCRLGSLKGKMPNEYKAKFPLIISASNPGNVGHEWVKEAFVDIAQPGVVARAPTSEGGKKRVFIKSTIEDNPYLEADYADALSGLGSEDLVKAMKYGDWNVLAGAFFKTFSDRRNMIHPFKIPIHWPRICGMDWGYWYPFDVQWFARAEEDFEHPFDRRIIIPRMSLVCYRQWYGADPRKGKNRGLELDPVEVAKEILKIESDNEGEIDYRVADPKIFKSDSSTSVAGLFADAGVVWTPGENNHETGWSVLQMYIGPSTEPTNIFWFDNCINARRNFTNAVRDEKNPEEIMKGCEIHSCDTARYVAMRARAGISPSDRREPLPDVDEYTLTYGHMLSAAEDYEQRQDSLGPLEV